jgi:hypothetical protein
MACSGRHCSAFDDYVADEQLTRKDGGRLGLPSLEAKQF